MHDGHSKCTVCHCSYRMQNIFVNTWGIVMLWSTPGPLQALAGPRLVLWLVLALGESSLSHLQEGK